MSNFKASIRSWLYAPFFWLASCLACHQSTEQSVVAQSNSTQTEKTSPAVYNIPKDLPEWAENEQSPQLDGKHVTIIPSIQNQVQRFIRNGGNPISAVVIVDIKTGEILALGQGLSPSDWGSETHSALHSGFPSASLFKTITAAAGFEVAELDPEISLSMFGGCSHVNPRGIWPPTESSRPDQGLTLRKAYGHSCNGFFAKMAVNQIGLGPILNMAKKLGWNSTSIASDFYLPPSPLREPNASSSSIHTIGKFAAGFGAVGLSAVHAAWQYMTIANDGMSMPVHIFKKSTWASSGDQVKSRVIESETALNLRKIMDATVLNGTASSAFNRGRLRSLKVSVGGKTGTLTGNNPQGLTTWFAGLYPLEDPEIAVASVVMLQDLWHFKATNLAAASIMAYSDYKANITEMPRTARKSVETTSKKQ